MNKHMKQLVMACGIAIGTLSMAPTAQAQCTSGLGCWDPNPGPTPTPERIPINLYRYAVPEFGVVGVV